jgi:pyruvate kinase
VLDRVRTVAEAKRKHVAMMLDTKGPEIRTAMLRDHKNIQIDKGQEVGPARDLNKQRLAL